MAEVFLGIIKGEKGDKGDGAVTVDQTYNNKSENPQSGVAVAEALTKSVADWNQLWSGSPSYIKNKPTIPKTFHFMSAGYEGLDNFVFPDALEWFLAHPYGEGRYTTTPEYSEPLMVVDSRGNWICKHVSYDYAEIDIDNVIENARWEDFDIAKASDIPKGSTTYGTQTDGTTIKISAATESQIKLATHEYKPIVPSTLGYGVGCHGIVRLSTMPTAASKYLGWIVLYVGETDDTYTKNRFYECINEDGYKWVEFTFGYETGDEVSY